MGFQVPTSRVPTAGPVLPAATPLVLLASKAPAALPARAFAELRAGPAQLEPMCADLPDLPVREALLVPSVVRYPESAVRVGSAVRVAWSGRTDFAAIGARMARLGSVANPVLLATRVGQLGSSLITLYPRQYSRDEWSASPTRIWIDASLTALAGGTTVMVWYGRPTGVLEAAHRALASRRGRRIEVRFKRCQPVGSTARLTGVCTTDAPRPVGRCCGHDETRTATKPSESRDFRVERPDGKGAYKSHGGTVEG